MRDCRLVHRRSVKISHVVSVDSVGIAFQLRTTLPTFARCDLLFRGRLRAKARSVNSTSRPAALPLAALLAIAASVIAPAAAPDYSGELIFPREAWHNNSSSIVGDP